VSGPEPAGGLEKALEFVLSAGVLLSGATLLAGLTLRSAALQQAGILLLMLTPVARVVVLTVGLVHERDWLFAAVSLWILGVLGFSMLVAVRLP
jgi:uncharacterized membrane protein